MVIVASLAQLEKLAVPVTSADSVCQIEELSQADSMLAEEAEGLACSVASCVLEGSTVSTIELALLVPSTAREDEDPAVAVSAPTQIVLVRVALTVTVLVPITLRSLMSLE